MLSKEELEAARQHYIDLILAKVARLKDHYVDLHVCYVQGIKYIETDGSIGHYAVHGDGELICPHVDAMPLESLMEAAEQLDDLPSHLFHLTEAEREHREI